MFAEDLQHQEQGLTYWRISINGHSLPLVNQIYKQMMSIMQLMKLINRYILNRDTVEIINPFLNVYGSVSQQ